MVHVLAFVMPFDNPTIVATALHIRHPGAQKSQKLDCAIAMSTVSMQTARRLSDILPPKYH